MFSVKKDHFIMEQLKVQELRHYIADTNKGALTLMLRKGESKYIFVLDAVPVEKDVHDELMAVLFPERETVYNVLTKETKPMGGKLDLEKMESLYNLIPDAHTLPPVPKKRGRPFAAKKQ